jgi:hypothetical protein
MNNTPFIRPFFSNENIEDIIEKRRRLLVFNFFTPLSYQ